METNLKVLVYRDRTGNKKCSKVNTLWDAFKTRVKASILVVLALVVTVTGTVVVYGDMHSETGEGELQTYTCTALTEAVAASIRTEELLKDRVTVLRRAESMEEDQALAEDTEDNDVFLMEDDLLSGNYMAGGYIPVNMGAEESQTDDMIMTREELIEARRSEMVPEEAVPSKLTYLYNPEMRLELSSDELEVLERIVEAEAGDQDIYGRMLVANVVINRIHDSHFPNSVRAVVYQSSNNIYQFAPVKNGSINRVKVTEKTREAVRRVLSGEDYSNGAEYFFMRSGTTEKKASWFDNSLKYLFKYGCHEFYMDK